MDRGQLNSVYYFTSGAHHYSQSHLTFLRTFNSTVSIARQLIMRLATFTDVNPDYRSDIHSNRLYFRSDLTIVRVPTRTHRLLDTL